MSRLALAAGFLRRDFRAAWGGRFSLVFHLLNLALSVTGYFFVSRLVEPSTLTRWTGTASGYFPYVLIGMAGNGAMISALNGLTRNLELQKPSGVLKPIFFSGVRVESILACSSLHPLLRSAADLVIYLALGWALGGLPLAGANLPAAILVALLGLAALAGLGIWAAALSVLFRVGNPILWALASSSWLLGGVLSPPDLLPAPLRWAAECLPLTHVIRGLRGAILGGASWGELLPSLVLLGGFALLAPPVGAMLFRLGLHRARVLGLTGE